MSNEVVETRTAANIYTNEDRKKFAQLYVFYGSVATIAQLPDIPDYWKQSTMYGWLKSDWWPSFYAEAKREYAELVEARLSDVVEKATTQLLDRIQNGDWKEDKKGNLHRVPVSAKDLNTIVKESVQQIRTLQNKPNKVTVSAKVDLRQIERNFAEMAEKYQERIVSEQ